MNKSPLNFLVTLAFGAILWVIAAVFYGPGFSESIIYKNKTPDAFLSQIQITLGIAAALAVLNCIYWYVYGNRNSTAGELGKAKKTWWVFFILQIVLSAILLFVLVILNVSEGILTINWLILYALLSLLTWFFFWLCTFLMSPRNVKFIPLFK